MDVRGIEVTNQLRSAIRAKLLELGVRYDEELPDYILVMVVNKKSRQQMHEDLHLFLENSTTPFVDWLHDQVLKKLQKVTIAKKKPTREFVPTVVVKQEEERKKKKNSGLVDQLKIKEEPVAQKSVNKSPQNKGKVGNIEEQSSPSPPPPPPLQQQQQQQQQPQSPQQHQQKIDNKNVAEHNQSEIIESSSGRNTRGTKTPVVVEETLPKQPIRNEKNIESAVLHVKRPFDKNETSVHQEKRLKTIEPPKESTEKPENNDIGEKRLKSCVNKPKITSVVSVKTRLGITTPRNKFEIHREQIDTDHRRQSDKRVERRLYEPINRRDHLRERNDEDEVSKKNKDDLKNRQISTIIINKNVRTIGTNESNEKFGLVSKRSDNLSIKDRLGVNNKLKQKEIVDDNQRNIKNRLGPVKSKFIALGRLGPSSINKSIRSNIRNNVFEDEDGELEEESTMGPVKSHIIAVNNAMAEKIERRNLKLSKRLSVDKGNANVNINDHDNEDNNDDGKIIASKVTVTPRPLKPLQPIQKRATQSLLLRAVAEANQSVVKQKNPEPILLEKKPALKRLKPSNMRTTGQNLAVHFNANKRLVMEKIQVELTTSDTVENNEPEPYVPRAVTEEQMGVVMSLFQRGNDNQKFLVTLNGYNNNVNQEKNYSEDDDERLIMEVNDDDELSLSNTRNESFADSELSVEHDKMENLDKSDLLENNENHCISENLKIVQEVEDVEEEEVEETGMGEDIVEEISETVSEEEKLVKKRRKLSPIIYTRSRSPTPDGVKNSIKSQLITTPIDKRSINTCSNPSDKSQDKCRYWPTCTLGNKCAYMHPKVPCSAFPACKFGDKCAYKHPKCKFGLSCTKLGCVFSHPSQQCKYHPFCTKPGCSYLHPPVHPVAPVETVRGKFTWRRHD